MPGHRRDESNFSMTDLIIIGAGHAAIEAALAGPGWAFHALLITLDKTKIGQMSCNPAVGGVGKGQVVREIDALGGEMARATDRAGLQFKMLEPGERARRFGALGFSVTGPSIGM
jgi:tRNA uridine 5-carboxymethylaminomethyl modification enzyme